MATRNWMSVYGKDITLDGDPLKAGDRIDFYTSDGIQCGAGTYGDGLLKFTSIYGSVGGDEASKAYPKIGDEIRINVNGVRVLPDVAFEGDFARVPIRQLTTSLDDLVPKSYSLSQNYPNPFNPVTAVKYGLPASGEVNLAVYNVLGQRVRQLVSGYVEAGQHEVDWNGTDDNGQAVSTGVYLYRLDAGDYSQTKKMIFVK